MSDGPPAALPIPADHDGLSPRARAMPRTCLGDAREILLGGRSKFAAAMPTGHWLKQGLRKWWEWDAIAATLESLGLLDGNADALGLAVGCEPLIFDFANRCRSVVALDRYAPDTDWSEARFSGVQAVLDASPIDYARDRLKLLNADMRHVPASDASFDFVWSCSSIEHVHRPSELLALIHEVHRLLRPGGVAVLTTEFSLLDTPYLMPGVLAWDRLTLAWMREALPGFEWCGPDDLTYSPLHPGNAPIARRDLFAVQDLSTHPADLCRGGVARLAGISVLAPILLTLRKTHATNAEWHDIEITRQLRAYDDALIHHECRDDRQAAEALAPLFEELQENAAHRQWALHAGRLLLEAEARSGLRTGDTLRARIEDLMQVCPAGPLQDADCLDLCGYLLGELADYGAANEVDRRCLDSPSTTAEHLLALAARVILRNGSRSEASGHARSVVHDLLSRGVPRREIEMRYHAPLRRELCADFAKFEVA